MKITFVMPVVKQNGGCRVVAIYAEKLLAMGHDVTVVSRLPEKKSTARRLVDRLQGRHAPEDPGRTAYFDALGARHVQLPWKVPLDAGDVPDGDVVIATWWRTAFEVAALPPEKGAKVYFVQGHEVYENLPNDLSRGSYYLPLSKITIARWLVDTMASLYGDREVALVPNGVNTEHFTAPRRGKAAMPTVGLMYSEQPYKGTGVGLRAVESLRQSFPDLRLVAFGAVDPVPDLPLPGWASYHRLPPQPDLPGIYASCDAWIVPSTFEGFGLPILEAMACRTPVVATRTGAAPDLIEDGVEGYVVDVEDHDAIAARLARILSLGNDEWQRMSDAAHARAQRNTWAEAAASFENALAAAARAG